MSCFTNAPRHHLWLVRNWDRAETRSDRGDFMAKKLVARSVWEGLPLTFLAPMTAINDSSDRGREGVG